MATPEELRRAADQLDRDGWAALHRGEEIESLALFSRAEVARSIATKLERSGSGLTGKRQSARVNGKVTDLHRHSLSRAVRGRHEIYAFMEKAGIPSLRALAEKMGVSAAFLSRVFSGKQAMPDDRWEQLEKLTGYPKAKRPR